MQNLPLKKHQTLFLQSSNLGFNDLVNVNSEETLVNFGHPDEAFPNFLQVIEYSFISDWPTIILVNFLCENRATRRGWAG